jgi:GT2 family glycosyltransferase
MEKELSIVIISMNNLKDLEICLDSLFLLNTESYQIIVIAFNFSDTNLQSIISKYGDKIKIVQTSGIKGFAENNNEALRTVNTPYCMILNDDTYFLDNSIDKLLNTLKSTSIKIISPHILNFDGTSQILGWPKYNVFNYMLHELKVRKFAYVGEKNQELFKTYSVTGACFVIDTSLFRQVGFFDEKYFFTPEDIALSAKCIKLGYYPYVLKGAVVYHKGSSTAKKMHQVTIPVAKQGIYLYFREFYGKGSELVVRLYIFCLAILKLGYWSIQKKSERKKIMTNASINLIKYAFKNEDTKPMFEKLYLAYTNS